MFNFKAFATAAVAAASIFTQAPAVASQLSAGEQALATALERAGVKVEAGDCSEVGLTDTYGFFVPEENYIGICTDVATTAAMRWETLRHEAIHAAQKCKDPSMTSMVMSVSYIEKNARISDWHFIQRAYEKHDWAIEIEAFTLMRMPNSHIATIVERNCNW